MQILTNYMVNGIEWEGMGEGKRDRRVVTHLYIVGQSWKYNGVSDSNGNA